MQDNNNYRVAIYCRVANEDNEAMQSQLRTMRIFAQELGFADCIEYLDNGYSGISSQRPAFAKMNEDIRAGHIQTIFVKDEARLYRSFHLFRAWLDDMEKQGVDVHTLQGKIGNQIHAIREYMNALACLAK